MTILTHPVWFRTEDVPRFPIFDRIAHPFRVVAGEPEPLSGAPHGGTAPFWWPAFRIYYPASLSAGAPLLSGPFPLVIFAHGQRSGDPDNFSSPTDPDPSRDYTRWGGVLHLLARCGFVVASVNMRGALGRNSEAEAARRISAVERWLYHRWEHADILAQWVTEGNTRDHRHRPLGLIGHSFGIAACARVAKERGHVQGVAGIAATYRGPSPREELAAAGVPCLFISGTEDVLASPASQKQAYRQIDPPKHLAEVQGADHWDWFDDDGLTPPSRPDACEMGYRIAGELLVVFFHRYLNDQQSLPPSLLTMRRRWRFFPPGIRWVSHTANRPSLSLTEPCALRVEWTVDSPKTWDEPVGQTGTETLGPWSG